LQNFANQKSLYKRRVIVMFTHFMFVLYLSFILLYNCKYDITFQKLLWIS